MKKILILVLPLTAAAFIAWLVKSNYDLKQQLSKLSATRNAKETYDACSPCADTLKYPSFQGLDVNMLKDMSDLYKRTGSRVSNDATNIWFQLSTLKQFIWQIEKDTCGKTCPDGSPLKLGIRLYYARYPSSGLNVPGISGQLKSLDSRAANLHTLFMVPTYDSAGKNIDFDPALFDATHCRFLPITIPDGINNHYNIRAFMVNSGIAGQGDATVQNHGSLCPPLTNCDGAAF